MSKAICSECGSSVEIADGKEWGYCPMCENDQVEVKIGNSNGDFVDLLNKEMYELKIADLEAKLAESEEEKESYRLQNDEHHLQLCQFYSRLGVEAFGADIHEKALETLMIMKEKLVEFEKVIEKYDCKSVKRLNGRLYRYDQYETKIFNMEEEIKGLKQQLAEKEKEITQRLVIQERDYNQDKILFAVEQLEKTRNGLVRYAGAICNEDGSIKKYDYVIKDSDFEKLIDNQINVLRNNKDGIH